MIKYFIGFLFFVCSVASAQTNYTYPGYGYLQEQNGTRINTKRYTNTQECINDAYAENNRRKAANPSLLLSAVECVTSTGYVTTWPTQPRSPGLGVPPTNPVLNSGYNTPRISGTSDFGEPARDGVGAFRIICEPSHYTYDDPIVFPGQPGRSHLHLFYGNTLSNAYSTRATMSTTGNSTCAGGILNRSSYWIPAMVNTTTGAVVNPTNAIWYYKCGYKGVDCTTIKPIPKDLRMIAGDSMSSTPGNGVAYEWVCHDNYGPQHGPAMQNCAVGDKLELRIVFPQCWNGQDLDSPDHKSHMAYAQGGCPSTHPVALPELSLNVDFEIFRLGQANTWRLSSDTYTGPAGYSAHADFWSGWDDVTMQKIISGCIVARRDCHAHLLGNGQTLY